MLEAAASVWLHGALFTNCLVIVLKLWPMRCQGRSGGKDRVWEKILHSNYGGVTVLSFVGYCIYMCFLELWCHLATTKGAHMRSR